MDDITYAVSVDVNNPIIPYNVYVASVLDSNVRYLEITLYQNGNVIALSNTAIATASLVTDNVLVDDSVNCTISDNIITVPLEGLQRHGNLNVQVTVIEGTKVLAIPFPIQVRVTPNIAEEAQVDGNSMGSYAEVVQEIADARGDYISLSEALNHKLSSAAGAVKTANIDTGAVTEAKLATNSVTTTKIKDGNVTEAKLAAAFKNTLYKVDTTARSSITSADIDSKKIYTNFTINYNGANRKAIVMNFDSTQTFIALCADGMIFTRTVGAGWQCIYNPNDKATSITNSNKSSNILFPTIKAVVDYIAALFATVINNDNKSSNALLPTIKAVVDYLTANYIGNGSGTVTENNLATALKNSIYRVDNTTENVIYSADNQRIIYTNARVNGNNPTLIFTLGDDSQLAMYKDCHLYCRTYANGAYGNWIDLKATSIGESNKTSDAYSTVRAVYNFVTAFVASAISGKANTSDVNAALTEKDEYIKLMDEANQKAQADLEYLAMMTEVELE